MLVIREALPKDADALYELYMNHLTQFPPSEPQNMDEWASMLEELAAAPHYHLLVGEIDGAVVSSVTLVVVKNLTHNLRPYAVIENVVTRENFRNQGCASALMGRASEIAVENRCYKIMLMTGSKKESTFRFYERCGFSRNEKTAFLKRL